jgi:hypothetical protein
MMLRFAKQGRFITKAKRNSCCAANLQSTLFRMHSVNKKATK